MRKTMLRRTPRRAIAVFAMLVTLFCASAVASTTPAGAAANDTSVSTICGLGQMIIYPGAAVSAGYTNGQYMSYRYNLQSNRGHNITSGWSSTKTVPFNSYSQNALDPSTVPAQFTTQWWVQVQVARFLWNGSAWTVSYSPWVRSSYLSRYGFASITACLT